MNYADVLTADQRLVILGLLAEQIAYKANSSVLTLRMDQLGHAITRDRVRTLLGWLGEQGLVALDEPVAGIYVATLTERGADVVAGRAVVPGVARPAP